MSLRTLKLTVGQVGIIHRNTTNWRSDEIRPTYRAEVVSLGRRWAKVRLMDDEAIQGRASARPGQHHREAKVWEAYVDLTSGKVEDAPKDTGYSSYWGWYDSQEELNFVEVAPVTRRAIISAVERLDPAELSELHDILVEKGLLKA